MRAKSRLGATISNSSVSGRTNRSRCSRIQGHPNIHVPGEPPTIWPGNAPTKLISRALTLSATYRSSGPIPSLSWKLPGMDVSLTSDTPSVLKLLMTADTVGGVWQYAVDLLGAMARHNVQAVLATMGPRPSAEQRRQILAIPQTTLEESDFALEWMPNAWPDVDASHAWLCQLVDHYQPDIIHLNGYSHAAQNWSRPVVSVAHSCVYSWWRAVREDAPDEGWSEYQRRVTAGLRSSDSVVAPSAAMASCLEDEYQFDPATVRVIHNFTNSRPVENAGLKNLRKEPFFLAAGRLWDLAKNLGLLDQI